MGDAGDRLDVMPSRMVLQGIKEKLGAARTGHSLLKRKSDAIKISLQNILKKNPCRETKSWSLDT